MVRPMPRGGKRIGSGRKRRSWFDPTLHWVVRRVRELIDSPIAIHMRQRQYIKRKHSKQMDRFLGLEANYRQLKRASIAERRAMLVDDVDSPLEDTREILANNDFPRYYQLRQPDQFQLNRIYNRVAKEATVRFGKNFTARKVKDFTHSWNKFEQKLSDDD